MASKIGASKSVSKLTSTSKNYDEIVDRVREKGGSEVYLPTRFDDTEDVINGLLSIEHPNPNLDYVEVTKTNALTYASIEELVAAENNDSSRYNGYFVIDFEKDEVADLRDMEHQSLVRKNYNFDFSFSRHKRFMGFRLLDRWRGPRTGKV